MENNPGAIGAFVFALFVPFFLGLWVGVTALLASLSGWPRLAGEFPGGEAPPGTRLRRMVIKFGVVGEQGVTVLIPTEKGLYLFAVFPFRFRRPPVLVPWKRIRHVTSHRFLWARALTLDLGDITTIRVRDAMIPVLTAHGVRVEESP